jgi:hypothetical protein
MARLIVPQGTASLHSPIDATLPMTCVIESSYVVDGHGVINKICLSLFRKIDLIIKL